MDEDRLPVEDAEKVGPAGGEWAETDPDRGPAGYVSARNAEKLPSINEVSHALRSPARSAARG